ncbi:MAG: hypothetical protein II994_06135 [Lachnospiraceae bacterium]|nr:hypothetical protein [Lachnospiraceae bacterium]
MKKKLLATMLIATMAVSMVACGDAEGTVAGGKETVTDGTGAGDSKEPVKAEDAYSMTIDESGNVIYSFDTSAFNPELFDDKFIIDTIEVPLPLGSIREIQEMGVDMCDEDTPSSEEDLCVNGWDWTGKGRKYDRATIEVAWGILPEDTDGQHTKDDYMDVQLYTYTDLENITEEEGCVVGATIDGLDADFEEFPNDAVKVAKVLGIDCNSPEEFTVDKLVERFGIPIYYYQDSQTNYTTIHYFYGDYSLSFGTSKDAPGVVESMTYLSSEGLATYVNKCENEWAEYDSIAERWLNYNKVCEEYR